MWPDWKQRAEEILQYADLFDHERYVGTTRWMRHLAAQIGEKKPAANLEANLERNLEEARRTFRSEFSQSGPSYAQVIKFVEPIVNFHVSRPFDEQRKFQGIFQDLARNSQNLRAIDDAFKGFPPGRTRFYGKCLLYLVNAEGMFDEAITLLYGLFLDFVRKPVSIEDLHMISLEAIMGRMLEAKASPALFDGWDKHVRNAIAHCRFSYDTATGIMTFEDRNLKTHEKCPTQSFSVEQFDELYRKLDSPWHAISHLIFMMRVIDLVMRSNVSEAGKLSPIGHPRE
jgi:hypothetical protein